MTKPEQFRKLTDFEHARLRTELYFGSREPHTQSVLDFSTGNLEIAERTWVPALWTGFREIIDNSLDEVIGKGFGDSLWVEFNPETLVISVEDNGRGIPIHEIPELGKGPAASILIGEPRAGRNFDEREDVAGMNGVGASITNFTSEWLELEIHRSGEHDKEGPKNFTQRWEEATRAGKEVHRTKGPHIIRGSKKRSGTKITYRPSSKVFPKMILPMEFVSSRLWDIAVTNPKLKVFLNGKRLQPETGRDSVLSTYFPEAKSNPIEVQSDSFRGTFYLVPSSTSLREPFLHSLVNRIPIMNGGTHMDGFLNVLWKILLPEIQKKTKAPIDRKDIGDLIVFGNVRMDNPNFDSQSKTRLVSDIKLTSTPEIEMDVRSFIRRNPEWVNEVIARAERRTSLKEDKKLDEDQKKALKQRSSKVMHATGRDRSKCVLYIMEGESAVGNMPEARHPERDGVLELRGKTLNTHTMKPNEIVKNQVILDIMKAIGLKIGEPARRGDLRYGSVYIATDEDPDGKNITALLVDFFYRFWPELFRDKPFLYRLSTPYLILIKGDHRKYIFAHDYEEFRQNTDLYKGWKVVYAKGLGVFESREWEMILNDPVLYPFLDDGKMSEVLNLVFDDRLADLRKEWLCR